MVVVEVVGRAGWEGGPVAGLGVAGLAGRGGRASGQVGRLGRVGRVQARPRSRTFGLLIDGKFETPFC